MAANTMTSTTGTVAGTDPSFTVVFPTFNHREGAFIYLKYATGTSTSITVAPTFINKSVHATDYYAPVIASGSLLSAISYTISVAGNYRIPIPLTTEETSLRISIAFNAAAQGGSVIINKLEE